MHTVAVPCRATLLSLALVVVVGCNRSDAPTGPRLSPSFQIVTPDAAFAYVVNAGSSVSVIETATNTLVTRVTVGFEPRAVAITPNGALAYVANRSSGTLSVISTATNTVTATVPVGDFPTGIAFTPDGQFAYLAKELDTVYAIATATNTVAQRIAVGDGPLGIAVSPDGAFVYVTNRFSNSVSVISTATARPVATVPVGSDPVDVAISPDGAVAYVACAGSGQVSVIDAATNSVVATIAAGGARDIAFTRDGDFAYVTRGSGGLLSVIRTATHTRVGQITLGDVVGNIAVTPDGSAMWVSRPTLNQVAIMSVIPTSTFVTSSTFVASTFPGPVPGALVVPTVLIFSTPASSTFAVPGPIAFGGGFVAVNEPPVVGAIAAPVAPVQLGTLVSATAPFTDVNTADTHTGVFDWGDGTSSPAIVTPATGGGTAAASHTYTAADVFTITLTVTDNHGAAGEATYPFLVVFNATGGYVTGAGWLDSPAGAYGPLPDLEGRAQFGFQSKYIKGANVPTGDTRFRFKAADFDFESTSYEWLVVSATKGQFKGSGTINGTGDFAFKLTAIDGDANGGGGADRLRLKVSDKATGTVIYDNLRGADDSADPTGVLGGGNIVVHK